MHRLGRNYPTVAGVAHVPHGWVHRFGNAMICGPITARPTWEPIKPETKICGLCAAGLWDTANQIESILTDFDAGTYHPKGAVPNPEPPNPRKRTKGKS